ncbi:toxin-antitoxin system YwqK family antitoxin [Fulvivirga ligni]|uniref:toxin-antitoxin system YwqK family antitoxin n=1 Tax=Fulvivirga ligni TaxID=2904246 RepID=UPI001F23EA3A|nr:hypothetical protein [Fulvivirga ligni]UII21644.1 hypothetical protein LVD16_00125 [Fulvivirga ligni]
MLLEISQSQDGKNHGKYVRYYPSGKKYFQVEYSRGQPTGKATEWHENGKIKIAYYYENGLENGSYILWDSTGTKLLEGQMKDCFLALFCPSHFILKNSFINWFHK